MPNLYKSLRALFPDPPLLVGEVIVAGSTEVTIELPDGSNIKARGSAQFGDRVFVRDGVIEGPAPLLDFYPIEV